jgi:hypothetical protein
VKTLNFHFYPLKDPDKNPTAVGFQPFDDQERVETPVSKNKSMKGLYESFIPEAQEKEDGKLSEHIIVF